MTTTALDPIKLKHRAMWAMGDYDALATEVIPELGTTLVAAAGAAAGQRVLDVAAGSGNASLPAAATGAAVTASDLCPELVAIGRRRSTERGLPVDWAEADAERLPYPDDAFDTVLSCVGVMFAPFHQPVADELVRVTRPGGTIALVNWTPTGFIGQLFSTMKQFLPPPPAGASPGPLWGDPVHVRALFGDRVTDVSAEKRLLPVRRFADGPAFRDFFARTYGPTISAYRAVADDPARTAELDTALVDLARRHQRADGAMDWEYLLFTARVG
ncbi:class I SAM-dependent methyltransferase [Nakamurella endophytica]|uniref:Methyltransferase type 11 domain-containing protein n=1 Tax=Nakamurella endophytica TaxID=1748367 RepID=A0A917SPB4_9ACTN|nr:class I SAM-dependent methyltransferase [Nakamurella endophytica]GGL92150.1 hypothetical protein GCM10011594_09870 [Nakamurella endophytica]